MASALNILETGTTSKENMWRGSSTGGEGTSGRMDLYMKDSSEKECGMAWESGGLSLQRETPMRATTRQT